MFRLQTVSWLFPTVLCLCLSVLYMLEWRSSRGEHRQAAAAYADTVKNLNAKLANESVQTRSGLNAIKDGIAGLSKQLGALSTQQGSVAAQLGGPGLESTEATELLAEGASAEVPRDENLPELPPNTNSRKILEDFNAESFFGNPLFNPSGKELNRSEMLQADNLITRAKARLMTLQSDIHLLVGDKMDEMLQQGLFVDYEKGQERIRQPGVYTSGEPLEGGGMRIYSFSPEEHPKLYEMREEFKRIPNETVRRLMGLVMSKEGGALSEAK